MVKPSGEHVLVCLSSSPSNANIIRTAKKMADAFGGTLTALHVETGGERSDEDRGRLQANIRLAGQLDAVVSTVTGVDIAEQIVDFARRSQVTKVVIGRSGQPRTLFGGKPLTERLIELAPDFDIYIIPDPLSEYRRAQRYPIDQSLISPPKPTQWLITLAMLVGATLLGLLFGSFLRFTRANTITLYLFGAVLTALFARNHVCNIVHALGSVTLFNFFIVEPKMSFKAYSRGSTVTMLIMMVAAMIIGTLTHRMVEHAKRSSEAAVRTRTLLETNKVLQQAEDDETVLRLTALQLGQLLDRELVVYPVSGRALGEATRYPLSAKRRAGIPVFVGEPDIAVEAIPGGNSVGAMTDSHPEAAGLYLPVSRGQTTYAVIGISMHEGALEVAASGILYSILGECSLALENRHNAREKEEAALLAQNEQLRANLLRAISHDLRTPLTSISGNAENLLSDDAHLTPDARHAMLADIYDDSIWLIGLVENLLAITRIGDGRMNLNLSAQLLDEVLTEALAHIRRKAEGHTLRTVLEDELMLAQMDARLITQVIINLVDNAVKYTPPGSTIVVSACRREGMIAISVADDGPGIPDSDKARVFEMFYSAEQRVADNRRSLGLGLALCRSIVHAHGGEITLTDNTPRGACFTFTLCESEVTLNE